MANVDGSSGVQPFTPAQTETDTTSSAEGNYQGSKVTGLKAEDVKVTEGMRLSPGLTPASEYKSVSLLTRLVNKFSSESTKVDEKVLDTIKDLGNRERTSKLIESHNKGVDKLGELKREKNELEPQVKGFEKKYGKLLLAMRISPGIVPHNQGDKLTVIRDGQPVETKFKHEYFSLNKQTIQQEVDIMKADPEFSKYMEGKSRMQDITQERAILKKELREGVGNLDKALNADTNSRHEKAKDGLRTDRNTKKSKVSEAVRNMKETIKTTHEKVKSDVKVTQDKIDKELQGLKSDRWGARKDVLKGHLKRMGNTDKQSRAAIARAVSPDTAGGSEGLQADRQQIKEEISKSRGERDVLTGNIDKKTKEKESYEQLRKDMRHDKERSLSENKANKGKLKEDVQEQYLRDRQTERERFGDEKKANSDLIKSLRGGKPKSSKN